MAYNTKPIVTDVDGNPISQYYNSTTDQYEPVEGSHGANKVILYNEDGTENNELSLIPILEKLSELAGTALDERTRQNNELQRIAFYDMLQQMLADGELKGDKGDKGDVGRGLEFDWQGTMLGVRVEGDLEFVYVDLIGPRGLPGTIENLDKIHIEEALGYTPVKSVNNVVADEIGNVELDIDTSEIKNRISNVEDDLAAHKAENATDAHLPKNVGLENVLNIKQVQIIETKRSASGDVILNIPTEAGVYFCVAMGNASDTPQIFEMFSNSAFSRVSIIEPKNATIVFDKINNTITISPASTGWTTYSIVRLY